MLGALDNSARLGKAEMVCDRFVVLLGEASTTPVLNDDLLDALRARFTHLDEIRYDVFDERVRAAKGHNALAALGDTDFIVTCDPGVIPDARAPWRLLGTFDEPTTGLAEAKRLPIEHPKAYDTGTGHTSSASLAFAMTPRSLFEKVGGFDEQTFVEEGADVDYSWMVREAGCHVVFQPAAIVFTDAVFTEDGDEAPTSEEQIGSAQAALLLAHKWSRDDVLDALLADYDRSSVRALHEAADVFRERRDRGLLVPRRDDAHEIGYFQDGFHAEHRYRT
ncbi:glycosyltransferase family 2 protein [Nocardioides sp. P5_C9_2]